MIHGVPYLGNSFSIKIYFGVLLDFLPSLIFGVFLQLKELWRKFAQGTGALINKRCQLLQELPLGHAIGALCMFCEMFYNLEKPLEVACGSGQPVDIIRAVANTARDLIDDLCGLEREGDDGDDRGDTT